MKCPLFSRYLSWNIQFLSFWMLCKPNVWCLVTFQSIWNGRQTHHALAVFTHVNLVWCVQHGAVIMDTFLKHDSNFCLSRNNLRSPCDAVNSFFLSVCFCFLQTHSLTHRRAVPGRRKHFDILLAEHKGRPKEGAKEKDKDGTQGGKEGSSQNITSQDSASPSKPHCPNGRPLSTLKLRLANATLPR